MRGFVLGLAFVLCGCLDQPDPELDCPANYRRRNDSSCYRLVTQPLPWLEAEIACEQDVMGVTHLVIINDAPENIDADTYAGPYVIWIGLSDRIVDGTFKWVSGVDATYTIWNAGEPNGGLDEVDCASMRADGPWEDAECTEARAFICEADGIAASQQAY